MGWAVGYDSDWQRDIGYGVSAVCDHPGCNKEINRGLSYVCGGDVYGGEYGCGLFFCGEHMFMRWPRNAGGRGVQCCKRCLRYKTPYSAKSDHLDWLNWKLTHPSWQQWRDENPKLVAAARAAVAKLEPTS